MVFFYNHIAQFRAKALSLTMMCLLLSIFSVQAQSVIYVNGVATVDNQSFESLTATWLVLEAAPRGTTPPAGTYQWLKNGQPQGSTTSYCYVYTPGVYRLRFNGSQLSTSIIVNIGRPSDSRNYTITDQTRYPGIKENQDLNLAYGLDKQVTYSDGLGRPLQEIDVNAAAGTGKDFVQSYSYGPQGEQTRSYLPFALGNNGNFKTNWQAEQNAFYQWVSPKVGRPGNNGPAFSETVTDNDPLGRVTEKASPGDPWKLAGGHTQQIVQRSSTGNDDVRLWSYTQGTSPGTIGTLVWTSGAALANTLTAVETRDEDHNWSVVFTNEKGQTVCRRTYLSGTPSQAPASATYLETAYAYDESGNQLVSIPPKAVQQLLNNRVSAADMSTFLEQNLYFSQYDALGRAIAQKVPGKGWSYIVYDRWDRVAASQDMNQSRRSIWSFNKYDALNRVIMTGEVYDTRTPVVLAVDLQNWPVNQRGELRADNETGYTLTQTFPNNIQPYSVATVDYYDDYDYFPIRSSQRSDLAFFAERGYTAASSLTRGLRTGGRSRTLTYTWYGQWLTSVVYYDQYGRVMQELKDNVSGNAASSIFAVDRTTTEYLFTGQVSSTFLTHRRRNAVSGLLETHTTDVRNDFDTKGRLVLTSESIDDAPYVYLQELEYNELGQVVDKKLGYDYANNSYIQSIDYRYNIRGWLTNINNRNLSNNEWLDNSTPNSDTEPADEFGLELKYEGGSTAPGRYNGNISGAIWNTTAGRMRQFGYEYDRTSRVTAGNYSALDYVGGNYVWTAEKNDVRGEGLYTISGIEYDPNGNITALNRSGLLSRPSAGAKVFGRVDQLAFAHDGNRLRTVTDAVPSSAATNDFENGPSAGATYTYDDNGNLTRDPNKKVRIYYNQLNLPYYFYFDDGNVIVNLYTTTGEKVSSTFYAYSPTGYTNKTVQRIQGFTYSAFSNNASTEVTVSTPTGRAIFECAATASSPAAWAHEYHIRDHQGSLRLVLKQEPVLSYRATMEPANAEEEEEQFKHVAETRQLDARHARSGTHSARLNAYQVDRANGPATMLPVAAGDSVNLEVFGLYDKGVKPARLSNVILPTLAIGGSLGTVPRSAPDGRPQTQQRLLPTITAGVAVAWSSLRDFFDKHQSAPQASFTYELYNNDSVLIKSETGLLSESGQLVWQQLQHGFRVREAGYVKVYLSNASGTNAWFDDMQARVFPAPTVQENHYDPFGQNLEEIEIARGGDSKEQYTGQERIGDFGLEWTDYGFRHYDPQLGRWHSTDPLNQFESPYTAMGNNPIAHVDADGRFVPLLFQAMLHSAAFQGAVVGGLFNAASQLANGGKFNWGALVGSMAGGAVAGHMSATAPNSFLTGGSLTRQYVGKALYAGLTAQVASMAGQMTSDLVNHGKVGDLGSYAINSLAAAGMAMGSSAIVSAYSYATWDRFDGYEKTAILAKETGYDGGYQEYLSNDKGKFLQGKTTYFEETNSSRILLSEEGLATKAFAKAVYNHEIKHAQDYNTFGGGINQFEQGFEHRAYSVSQRTATLGFVPSRYQNGWSTQAPPHITPFNILANLYR